jgi:hypothetical protein
MVAGINAALEQGVVRLDNDWDERWDDHRRWRFEVHGIPGIASASDLGCGELSVRVALWPTERAQELIVYRLSHGSHAYWVGECWGDGFLRRGLQSSSLIGKYIICKKERLKEVVALDVQPKGYVTERSL